MFDKYQYHDRKLYNMNSLLLEVIIISQPLAEDALIDMVNNIHMDMADNMELKQELQSLLIHESISNDAQPIMDGRLVFLSAFLFN